MIHLESQRSWDNSRRARRQLCHRHIQQSRRMGCSHLLHDGQLTSKRQQQKLPSPCPSSLPRKFTTRCTAPCMTTLTMTMLNTTKKMEPKMPLGIRLLFLKSLRRAPRHSVPLGCTHQSPHLLDHRRRHRHHCPRWKAPLPRLLHSLTMVARCPYHGQTLSLKPCHYLRFNWSPDRQPPCK